MNKQLPTPKAFKRSPSLEISTWYKGILTTQLAGEGDTGGAFDLVVSKMRKGTEPPPHVHSREHEFFYILAGELKVYVEGEISSRCSPQDLPLKTRPLNWLFEIRCSTPRRPTSSSTCRHCWKPKPTPSLMHSCSHLTVVRCLCWR